MRSVILVVSTAFVLTIGALIYFWVQPPVKHAVSKDGSSTTRPTIRRADSPLGISDGDHVAVKKYDPHTGELASEYMSETYSPRRGGLIDVKNATARFYLAHNQILELHGETGTFRTDTPQEGKRKGFSDTRAGTPNRGQLQNVTVTIIDVLGDPQNPTTRPSMTISMPNAAFDSENATIVTEAYTDPITHEVVAADQVPVKLRSPDTNPNGYDFDGRGMKMLWNERDHRLTSLDIIHGERLVIKNPKNVTQPKPVAPTKTDIAQSRAGIPPTALFQTAIAGLDVGPALLAVDAPAPVRRRPRPAATAPTTEAATEPSTTQPIAAARRVGRRRPYVTPAPAMPKIETSIEPPIYRAEFHDNVRIIQNDQPLATSDRMFVDFWMSSGGDDSSAATQPTAAGGRRPHPVTQPATTATAATITAATEPAARPAVALKPATQPATTRSADEAPVYIYWTGPLHVAPHSEVALSPHEQIVTLEGAPVVAHQQSSEILASRLVYRSEDGSLKAASTPTSVVTLTSTDAHGKSTIHTSGLEYYPYSQPPTAILTGKSNAQLPAQENGAMINAAWIERGAFRFEKLEDGSTAIKEADLTGNVHVDHPQLKLDSQRLEMAFASPTTKPAARTGASRTPASQPTGTGQTNLKQLVASDSVHCVMTDAEKKTQIIDGDRLTLLTDTGPDGKLLPRTVNCDGRVHAVDPDQDLHADHVAVTLVPSTRPSSTKAQATAATQPALAGNVDLQSLIAQGAVHVINRKDNSQAFSDTMLIDKRLGKTNVKLVGGQPGAKIIDKNNTVIGPIIDIAAEDQILVVDGAGEMIGTQQEHPGDASKPMDVTWTRNMRIDGRQNIVHAFGGVRAKTTEADGTVRTVEGEHAQLLLVDVPTTQPNTKPATQVATQVAATGPSTTNPSTRPADDSEPMAHKQVRQAIFQEKAVVNSALSDDEGLPIQRMRLEAEMIQYDVLAAVVAGMEPMKRITVPVPGRMIVEDYRPAATQPADSNTASGGMSAHGATAFQWAKSLVYDEGSRQAVMDGGVVIDHRDNVFSEDSMHITGTKVIADLEPTPPTPAKSSTTKPATRPASTQPTVRNVVVKDHVHVNMKGGELVADWIEYSPITRILIAHGTPEADAVFTRNVPTPSTTQPMKASSLGGSQPIRAQQLQWDAGADLPKITHGNATFRR